MKRSKNMIDLNICNIVKFIFTCESYAIFITESPNKCNA